MPQRQPFLNRIRSIVPKSVRSWLLDLYYLTVDGLESVLGRRDALTPPRGLLRVSTAADSDFKKTGQAFLNFVLAHCELIPDAKVLDVGCGVGRVAVALTTFLSSKGRYVGFDIVPREIEWCQKNIPPRFPNFHFYLADIYNKAYNPKGKMRAAEYRFPAEDAAFDLVVLVSVFTHMLSLDMEHYLAEITRVLKPGGQCLISFYLLNDQAKRNIEAGLGMYDFQVHLDSCRVQSASSPESAVAYEEEWVRDLFQKYRLSIQEPILYGTWSCRQEQMQDIVIASKLG